MTTHVNIKEKAHKLNELIDYINVMVKGRLSHR